MADPPAGPAIAARIVPVVFGVEPQVAHRKEVAIEVAQAQLGVDAGEVVGALLWAAGVVAEARIEEGLGILARRKARVVAVEHDRAGHAELQERRWREGEPHPRELRVRMVAIVLELSEEDQRLHRADPLPDPGQLERLGGAEPDLVERLGVVREQQRIAIAGTPGEAVAADQQLDVPERELQIAGGEPRLGEVLVA